MINGGTFTTALQNGVEVKPYSTGAGQTGELRFDELAANGTNYVAIKSPDDLTGNVVLTLPTGAGSSGQVLSTNGSGTLSWISPGGGGTVTSVGITAPAAGIGVSGGPVTGSGSMTLSLTDDLAAVEGISSTGSVERTGLNTWGTYTVTAAGKALIDDADTTAQRTTLGLGALATAASVSGGTGGTITDDSITDADINSAAAIAQSKISGLSTSLSGKEPTLAAGTTAQFYRGDKSWYDFNTAARGAVSITAPLTYNSGTGVFGLGQAGGAADGYLASSDFLAFNSKQAAITAATTVNAGTVTTALQNGVEVKPFNTGAGQTGELRFDELAANGANYVGFKAPDVLGADRIWTLPSGDGTSGQMLSTNGSGILGWSSATTGTVTSVGLTAPAAGITVSGGSITSSGSFTLSLADDLAAVEALGTTGSVERTGLNTWGTYSVTAAGKALIDDADASAQRTTLGLGSLATASTVSGGTGGTITDDSITDADINSAAAIAQSKISGLTTSLSGKQGTITTASVINGGTFTTVLQNGVEVKPYNTGAGQTGEMRFDELAANGTNYVGFKAPDTLAADKVWTLPAADGTSGQALTTNGTGSLAWSTVGGGSLTLSSKSSDYTVTTGDAGEYFMVSGNLTTLTLPTAATAGSGFGITVKSNGGWALVARSGSDQIEGATTPLAIPTQGVAQIVTDGTGWYVVNPMVNLYRGTPVSCGADCYANGTAITAGLAYTATGKALVLGSYTIWYDANGTRVLRVDGSDNWHKALNANGRTFSSTDLNKNLADIGGRVCPVNVYVDDGNKVATGRCVYYDRGNMSQRLDASLLDATTNQSTAGSYRLGLWDTAAGGNTTGASWYEGNIQTCVNKGMRLPLLYETSAADPAGTYKPADPASPSWSSASTGVPSLGDYTWTSSAYTFDSYLYWVWAGTGTSYGYLNTYPVRCVVP